MASLKGLLTTRNPAEMIEENLETGYIYSYTQGTNWSQFCNGVCWEARSDGTAIIEIWGSGGSGSRMCCCGDGLPGNAGAYVKKSITVEAGDTMTGCVGMSCCAPIYVFQDVQRQQVYVGSQHQTVMVVCVPKVDLVVRVCVLLVLLYSVVSELKVSVTQDVTMTTAD